MIFLSENGYFHLPIQPVFFFKGWMKTKVPRVGCERNASHCTESSYSSAERLLLMREMQFYVVFFFSPSSVILRFDAEIAVATPPVSSFVFDFIRTHFSFFLAVCQLIKHVTAHFNPLLAASDGL